MIDSLPLVFFRRSVGSGFPMVYLSSKGTQFGLELKEAEDYNHRVYPEDFSTLLGRLEVAWQSSQPYKATYRVGNYWVTETGQVLDGYLGGFLQIKPILRPPTLLDKLTHLEGTTAASVGPDYCYKWVDSQWSRVNGISQQAAAGLSLEAFWGKELFLERAKPLLDRAFRGETVLQWDLIPAADGSERTFESRFTPVLEGAPDCPFVLVVVREATASVQLQRHHSELESKLKLVFESARVINIILNANGLISEASPTVGEVLAASEPDCIGQPLIPLLQSAQTEEVANQFYVALSKSRKSASQTFECALRNRNGRLVDFQVAIHPLEISGEVRFYHLSCFDISERNANLTYLRQSEEHLKTLFQVTPAAIILVHGGAIVSCNPAALALLGLVDPEEISQKSIRHFFPQAETEGRYQCDLARLDGEILQVELTITPFLLEGKSHLLYLCYNLSEQKRVQEALRVAAATAETANRNRTAFLQTMSHEIRTPLHGMLGLLSVLEHTESPSDQQRYREKLKQATYAALKTINQVLDYSDLETVGLVCEAAPFDLREVLERVESTIKLGVETKGLGFSLEVDPAIPLHLQGDGRKLLRILLNLASNAVKFTAAGSVEVGVRLVFRENDILFLSFTVSDSGSGIPQDQLETVFEPVVPNSNFATRSYGGLGLGLFLSKRLAEVMGGSLEAYSEPGVGSRFVLSLPFTLSPPKASTQDQEGNAPSTLRGRVLIVDDNDLNREVGAAMLRLLGLADLCAASGPQALEMVQAHECDLILMDLQMPVMDGLETTRRLRAAGYRRPIIALSANSRPSDRHACLLAGMDDFLAKPVDPQTLRQCLRKYLRPGIPGEVARAPSESDFPEIYGINAPPALERLGGNAEMLRTLLLKFMERNEQVPQELRDLTARGDLVRIRALAHSLKGAAANLGIDRLANLSRAIEEAVRAGQPPEESTLSQFSDEFQRVHSALLALEPIETRLSEPRILDVQLARELLAELLKHLDRDLSLTFEAIERLTEVAAGTPWGPQIAQLRSLMDEFETGSVRQLAQRLQIELG